READVSREFRSEKRDFAESGLLEGVLGHAWRGATCDAIDIVNARGGQDIGDARAFAVREVQAAAAQASEGGIHAGERGAAALYRQFSQRVSQTQRCFGDGNRYRRRAGSAGGYVLRRHDRVADEKPKPPGRHAEFFLGDGRNGTRNAPPTL